MKVYLAGCYSRPWVFDSLVKDIHEDLSRRREWEKQDNSIRALGGGLSENLPRKSAHVREFQERKKSCDKNNDEGGYIPELDEDILSREYTVPSIYRSDAIRGGFSVNEDISGGGYYNRSLETILENRGGL